MLFFLYWAHIFGVFNRNLIWKQKKNSELKNNLGKRNADVLINIKKVNAIFYLKVHVHKIRINLRYKYTKTLSMNRFKLVKNIFSSPNFPLGLFHIHKYMENPLL